MKVAFDENVLGLSLGQPPNIASVYIAVTIEVEPQPAHCVDRNTVVRGPARIVGVIHIPAFPVKDRLGNL